MGVQPSWAEGLIQRAEFEVLAAVLAGLKGRYLLSLNDRLEVREIFRAFPMRTVSQHYPSGNQSPNHVERVHELLIGSNRLASIENCSQT